MRCLAVLARGRQIATGKRQSRDRQVCPGWPYDRIAGLHQTPWPIWVYCRRQRTCPERCRHSVTAQVMSWRAAPLPADAGARAGRKAACSAACNVWSALRELDVTRRLPAGAARPVLSCRGRNRSGGQVEVAKAATTTPPLGKHAGSRHGRHGDDGGERDVRRARCGAAGPARRDGVMSLPASQRRALGQIEKTLGRTIIPVSDRCSRSLPG
jgi:hypothetical protein